MVHRNDTGSDALLDQVIEHLRRQPIPDFPDPEIMVPESTKRFATSVHSISSLRRIVMNRRFQLSAGAIVGFAAALGFLLLWGGGAGQSVSAMEKMAENIRKARSFKAVVVDEEQSTSKTGKTIKTRMSGTVYWLATGTSRADFKGQDLYASGGPTIEVDMTFILFPDKSIDITVDHRAKTFCKAYGPCKADRLLEMIAKLGEFSGQTDRDLGTKEIDGKNCRGFEIDAGRLFGQPHCPVGPGVKTVEVWIDSKSSLPVVVQFKWKDNCSENTARIQDLQWNIDLDPKLFHTTVPKGYTDETPRPAVPPQSHATKPHTK